MLSVIIVLLGGVPLWWFWNTINRHTLHDAFSPLNLLFFFWVLPLLLSFMGLSGLQTGLSLHAILLITACTSILILSSLLPIVVLRNEPLIVRSQAALILLSCRRWLIIAFYFIALIALYFAEFHHMDIPLLAYLALEATASDLHTAGKDSKLQVIAFGVHVASMLIFFLSLNSSSRFKKAVLNALVLGVIMVGFLKAAKTDVYIPVLICSALLYYHHRSHGTRMPVKWKVFGAVVALLVVSVTTVRVQGVGIQGGYADAIDFKFTQQLGPVLSEVLSVVYGYTSLAFQNLSNFMDQSDGEFRLGSSFFRPLLSMAMQGTLAESIGIPVEKWGVVSEAANTGTYLTPLYIEAGAAGCLMASLVYGLLVNGVYVRFRRRGGVWMFLYLSLIFPWTWIFFTNAFSVLAIFTNLIYVAMFFVTVQHTPSPALVSQRISSGMLGSALRRQS